MTTTSESRHEWLPRAAFLVGAAVFVGLGLFLDRNHPGSIARGIGANLLLWGFLYVLSFGIIGFFRAIVKKWVSRRTLCFAYGTAIALLLLPGVLGYYLPALFPSSNPIVLLEAALYAVALIAWLVIDLLEPNASDLADGGGNHGYTI